MQGTLAALQLETQHAVLMQTCVCGMCGQVYLGQGHVGQDHVAHGDNKLFQCQLVQWVSQKFPELQTLGGAFPTQRLKKPDIIDAHQVNPSALEPRRAAAERFSPLEAPVCPYPLGFYMLSCKTWTRPPGQTGRFLLRPTRVTIHSRTHLPFVN